MSETYTYDNLMGGSQQGIVSAAATLALGQSLSRGALLGRILRVIGAATEDPGNTGEGTISGEAVGAKAKVGTYTIRCHTAGPPAIWEVYDPDGIRLADAISEVAYAGPIAFLIEAYGAAFVVGDQMTVVVSAGSGYVTQAALDHTDGSAEPYGILAEDLDASVAAKATTVYVRGEFAEDAIGFDGAETAADWRDLCAAVGIYLRDTVAD